MRSIAVPPSSRMSHCVKRCLETRAESTSVARHTEKSEGGLMKVVQKDHIGYPAAETPYDEAIIYPPTLPLRGNNHTNVGVVVEFDRRLGHVVPEVPHAQLFQEFHRVHQTWKWLERRSLKTRCDGEAWVHGRREGHTRGDVAAVQEEEWGWDDGGEDQKEEVGEKAKDALHCRGMAAWSNPPRERCRLKRAGFINGLGNFMWVTCPVERYANGGASGACAYSSMYQWAEYGSRTVARTRRSLRLCALQNVLTLVRRINHWHSDAFIQGLSAMEFCYGVLSWKIFGHWRSMRWSWRF